MGVPLRLVAPDWAALDTVRRDPLPFPLWNVCGAPLLAFWLEEALRSEREGVVIHAVDRPHLIRRWVEQGNYWSLPIEVSGSPPSEEMTVDGWLDRLPGMEALEPVGDGSAMLRRWLRLQRQALYLRHQQALAIDREVGPDIWLAPGARVADDVELRGPCWIGGGAEVGSGCRLGPEAYIGPRSILEEDVEVESGIIGPSTYVGAHTRVANAVAEGGVLCDWQRGVAVQIHDALVLRDLGPDRFVSNLMGRLLAWLGSWLLAPWVGWVNRGAEAREWEALGPRGRTVRLREWPRGPLWMRRHPWWREVARGRLRWFGVLPRDQAAWEKLEPEARNLLERYPAGVFALSDLHDAHSAEDAEEWLHAVYQAGVPDGAGARQVKRAWWRLIWKRPL